MKTFFLLQIICGLALADSEKIIFHKQAGVFDVTVFNKSEALRAGQNNISVLVQRADHSNVMNAAVLLHMNQTQNTGEITRLTSIATHAKASNKIFYSAMVNIPATGNWILTADVSSDNQNGTATEPIQVLAPLPPVVNYWPYVAMVPALGVAFLINRKLRERFRLKSRR